MCVIKALVTSLFLPRYYTRVYREFFLTIDANADKHSSVTGASGYVSDYHRFGWLLFLALRVHVFSRFKDLVTCTNGLVSILVSLYLLASVSQSIYEKMIFVLVTLDEFHILQCCMGGYSTFYI